MRRDDTGIVPELHRPPDFARPCLARGAMISDR